MLIGWVFFSFTELSSALKYIGRMFFIGGSICNMTSVIDIAGCIVWLAVSIVFCIPIVPRIAAIWKEAPKELQIKLIWIRPIFNIVIIFICTTLLVGQSYNPFLYFRF